MPEFLRQRTKTILIHKLNDGSVCNSKRLHNRQGNQRSRQWVERQQKKLDTLLQSEGYNILIVEHKDRLARFGTHYLDVLLSRLGIKLEMST
jgi:hypothetical protein